MKNICIIPARSGSKGLKDKNIKNINGKPLIAYTIEAAINSKVFDEIIVSTDSKLYANIAIKYGANVPFLRSTKNSLDNASSWDVVKEVLERYKKRKISFDTVFLLQPTSPLRDENDIISAFNYYLNKKANFVVGVCETDHSPLWCNVLPEDLCLNKFIDKKNYNTPRQKLAKYYRINGAIYIIDSNYLLNTRSDSLFSDKSFAFIMNKLHSIDIDDEYDFLFAESLIKGLN